MIMKGRGELINFSRPIPSLQIVKTREKIYSESPDQANSGSSDPITSLRKTMEQILFLLSYYPDKKKREAESVEKEGSDYFVRELELENDLGSISFYQKEVGEVNCVVYDSALVLGKFIEKKCIENEDYLSGKRVLELGSGLGCVGLVAAAYGGQVLVTDLPKALPLLELNVEKNKEIVNTKGGSIDTSALDWNSEAESNMAPFDVIVAADCIYYEEGVMGLINTLLRLSTSKTEIFLSQENRSYSEVQSRVWKYFCDEVLKCFNVKVIPGSQQHEQYRSGDIYIIQLVKPE